MFQFLCDYLTIAHVTAHPARQQCHSVFRVFVFAKYCSVLESDASHVIFVAAAGQVTTAPVGPSQWMMVFLFFANYSCNFASFCRGFSVTNHWAVSWRLDRFLRFSGSDNVCGACTNIIIRAGLADTACALRFGLESFAKPLLHFSLRCLDFGCQPSAPAFPTDAWVWRVLGECLCATTTKTTLSFLRNSPATDARKYQSSAVFHTSGVSDTRSTL